MTDHGREWEMRKLSALILILCLTAGVCHALAEGATATLNLDDFSMDYPVQYRATVLDKSNGKEWAELVDPEDGSNVIIIWKMEESDTASVSRDQAKAKADAALRSTVRSIEREGLTVKEGEITRVKVDALVGGRQALLLSYALTIASSGEDARMVCTQYIVGIPGDGTYVFNITAMSEEMAAALSNVIETVEWNI